MWVSTFHSMCVRILRAEAAELGMRSGFTIYDAADSQRLVQMVANDLNIDTKKTSAKALANQISTLKNELIDPDVATERADSDLAKLVAQVYESYQSRLRAANAFDFDDLIMQTVDLLQRFPAIAEHYRRRFRHVLVDEYQDTNHAQYMLVRELVGQPDDESGVQPAELVVVGDADQSIYAFRGATIRNIVEFERDYPNARTILLEQNYRSTQNILSAANAVIARNPQRRAKNLWTAEGAGHQVIGWVADSEYDEARFVAEEIDRLVDGADARFGDVAIFYRTNGASRAIEDVFVRSGMPYRIVGGVRFYERKEVRDGLAYLRAVANPDDEVSLRRILNTPRRGIGDRAEAQVAVFAEQERITFAQALERVADIHGLVPRSVNAITGFTALMAGLRQLVADGGDPADLMSAVLERTGYRAELEESERPAGRVPAGEPAAIGDGAARDDRVGHRRPAGGRRGARGGRCAGRGRERFRPRHCRRACRHRRRCPGSLPKQRRRWVRRRTSSRPTRTTPTSARPRPAPRTCRCWPPSSSRCPWWPTRIRCPDSTEGVVTLMTLHTAKGLEFPVVFVTGWEDGVFPHLRALADEAELAEERRLAYVGITRARQRLYLTRAVNRSAWGQPSSNPPSRFLEDIPPQVIDWRRVVEVQPYVERGGAYESLFAGNRPGYSGGGRARSSPVTASRFGDRLPPRVGGASGSRSALGAAPLELAVGDRVSHDKYGLGTVKVVEGVGLRATATIDFGTAGTVRLMLIGGVPMVKL